MRNIKFITMLTAISYCSFAQNGMDNVGPANAHFSKLSTAGNPNANTWERAMGVYQTTVAPVSYLEVNTNATHMTNPHPGIALGEVFRTNCPVDAHWRMFRNNQRVGHLY